jgi:ABC-2 type transport system ATP-binding protein
LAAAAPAVRAVDLRRTFLVPERPAGLRASVRSLVRRRHREVVAVDRVSFAIEHGEVVGFLGPNGAGKTTTLKMLAGLLYPTGGEARVLGFAPERREGAFLRQIALLMGNRGQLVWDLPVADSFVLLRETYGVPGREHRTTLDELVDLLELEPLLGRPSRNLSLGERMRCELAAALLHRPRVLFLDEPTLGLDVTVQRRLRWFLRAHNERHGATVLLTSHSMADIEALCRRVLVIHRGRPLYDGPLAGLVRRFAERKTIVADLADDAPERPDLAALSGLGEVVQGEEGRITLTVPRAQTAAAIGRLLATSAVTDMTVSEPPIDELIERVFAEAAGGDGG